MKINEAEQLLGITKANIRFYEKEGLLTPSRNESGYREYSEADIAQLKQIVILRKLGIPVQQIADILDGALPLQDALEYNIASLNAQIDALNGALFFVGISALTALGYAALGTPFLPTFFRQLFSLVRGLFFWTLLFIPIYLLRRKQPKLAQGIMTFLFIAVPIAFVLLFCLILYLSANP